MSTQPGYIYDAGDEQVANLREFFVDSDTRREGAFTKCDIAHMFRDTQRSVNGNDEGILVILLNALLNLREILGVNGFVQGAIDDDAFSRNTGETMSHNRAKTVARSAV